MTDPSLSYLDTPDVSPDDVGRFFETAAVLLTLMLWRFMTPCETFRIAGLTDGVLFASAIEDEGDLPGVRIFPSEEALRAHVDDPPGSDMPWLGVAYAPRTLVGRRLSDEIRRHGWTLADEDDVPALGRPDPQRFARLATAGELAQGTAVLEAIPTPSASRTSWTAPTASTASLSAF